MPSISSAKTAVPTDSILRFTSILSVKTNGDRANRYHLKIINNELRALEVNGIVIPDPELIQYKGLLDQIDLALAEKERLKRETMEETSASAVLERRQQLQRLKESQLDKWNHQQFSRQFLPEYKKVMGQKKADVKGNSASGSQTGIQKKTPQLKDISSDQERVRGVISALIEEKSIAGPTAIEWFGLSADELIVNGRKQSDAVHQKLKAQYGIRPQYGLYYGPVQMARTGVFLDKGEPVRPI